jgi:hypothetical protein
MLVTPSILQGHAMYVGNDAIVTQTRLCLRLPWEHKHGEWCCCFSENKGWRGEQVDLSSPGNIPGFLASWTCSLNTPIPYIEEANEGFVRAVGGL